MSEEVLREKVQRLVNSFREQLRGVLEECSASARKAPLVHRPRSDGTFATDKFEPRRRKCLPRDVCNQLHQLSGAVGVLSSTLNRPTDSFPRSEEGDMEELLQPGVVVCGPPGTEPKPGFSRTRLDGSESLVYSRSSTALISEASPFQKYVIPSKDVPKKMCQVNIFVPEEQLAAVSRCTRSRTSMFRAQKWKESSESESESITSGTDITESEEEEIVSRRKRKVERTRRRDHQKGKPRPPPLKCQQKSEPSSVANSDSDETVLEHPLSRSSPVLGAVKINDRDNPILKSILQGNCNSMVNTIVSSPVVSEEYETAKEDLSGTVDNLDGDDDKFYSFADEPSPTLACTSPGRRPHPLSSSKKAQRKNGEISVSDGKRLMESISIEKSGIYNVLKEITGYSEPSLRSESDEGDTSLFDTANSSRFTRMQTKNRRSIPITSIMQRRPMVNLTKVQLSRRQRERMHQKIVVEPRNCDSGPISPRSGVKLSASSSGEGDENDIEDIVAMEIGDSGDIIDSLNGDDIHLDDHRESSHTKEIPETPKSTKPLMKRSLSLTLTKKCTPDNKFTTPNLHALSKTVQPASSAKRKLQLEKRDHQEGSNMNSNLLWSSDSDFDNMSLSQRKSVSSTLVKRSTHIEKSNTPTTATTPVPRRKKVLSSFSSEDEEIIPPFLQKQKAEKAAQVKEREERSRLVNGDVFDDGSEMGRETEEVKTSEDHPLGWKSTKKLGKYEKSPAGRGKEKAKSKGSGFPDTINCAACNKNLHWKTKKIHSHPRLSVLVCMKCHGKFNQGSFTVEDDNEIYCTLCGDGGNLVCCSFCPHSFCQECIKRLSGEKHLDYLLSSDDVDFRCYKCNPTDIKELQELCEEVCYYFRAHSQGKKKKEYKSDKYVLDSESSTARSRETSTDSREDGDRDGSTGFSGGWGFSSEYSQGGKEGESSKRRGRSGKKGNNQQKQQEDSSSDKGNRSSASRGGEGGGGETTNRSKSRRQEDSKKGKGRRGVEKGSSRSKRGGRSGTAHTGDGSSSDSMSDVDESSEVDTDEISMSDSSLFEDLRVKKKDRKKVSGCKKRMRMRRGSDDKGEGLEGSAVDEDKGQESEKAVKQKKKRMIVGHLHDSLLGESDIESGDSVNEDQPLLSKERRKRRKQYSSDSGSKPSRKRGRLGNTFSSGSGSSDNDQERLAIIVSDIEMGGAEGGYDSNGGLFDDGLSKDGETIKYSTVKLNARQMSDSSGSDIVPLRRMSKKEAHRKVLGSNSSAEEEEETAETKKKGRVYKTRSKKRKKRGSGSEAGSSEDFMTDDLSLRGPRLNNRHKRLKLASFLSSDSSSEAEDSSSKKAERKGKNKKKAELEKPTTPKSPGLKRKNIRKLIADEKLEQSTKTAQREEEERLKRLKQKAKLLAPIQDSERVILEQDPESKEVKVEVRDTLIRELKPHQIQGIKFLYDSCIESLERFKAGQTNGAILAHCMGLGKTLQVIAFMDALLNCEESGVKHVLVLSPVNAIHNWMNEFHHWIPLMECEYGVYILREPDTLTRLKKLRSWHKNGGVILIGYEMYRNLAVAKKIRRKAYREELAKYLLDPGPDVVVCDEGHVMRNSKSNLSIVLGRIKTRTRIVLTGTPLQNNLLEYYTMVNFVKPNLLGTQKEFTNRFVNPIKNGQCRDSNPYDIRKMKQRAHVLYMLLQGSVQRRDYRVLAEHLPPKQEYVLNIRLSSVQDQLYRRYLEQTRGIFLSSDLFSTYHSLSKVWNHPWVLKLDEDRQLERAERAAMYGLSDSELDDDDDDTLGGFIVDSDESSNASSIKTRRKVGKGKKRGSGSSRSSSLTSSRSATPSVGQAPQPTCIIISSDDSDDDSSKTKKKDPEFKPEQLVKRETGESSGLIPRPPPREKTPPPWYDDLLSEESLDKIELSGKLLFLVELLKEAEKLKEKVLVFSQSLLTLDLIEEFLGKEENGDWTPALDYYRLDGSTRAEMRMNNMTEFNKLKNSRLRLFLISTRAGSLGVNLVGANRVVIFDACWNPSHDLQAIFRTYRYGQTRPIFVYRLLAQGTMEEKIYDRQVTKQSLSMRVVDEKQIGRHFTQSDLAELFSYSPAPLPDQSAKPIKKPEEDMVLSSILGHMHPQWIISYHEHDSLLEHVFDEELSEAERKAAWDSYKAEKAAETARYNVEALHTKLLREEELERVAQAQQQLQQQVDLNSAVTQFAARVVAARQAIHAMQQQRMQAHPQPLDPSDPNMLVQNIVINIDRTLYSIKEVQGLHLKKRQLTAPYAGAALPPEVESQKRLFDRQIQQGYSQVSKNIQFANDNIGYFNHSQAARDPRLLHIVSMKRQELNAQLEALKSTQSKLVGGAALPTGSLQGASSGQHNHVTGGPSGTSGKVSSSSQTKPTTPRQVAPSRQGTDSQVRERLIARVAGSNEERQERETVKELLVKKTKAPADSSSNLSTTKKN